MSLVTVTGVLGNGSYMYDRLQANETSNTNATNEYMFDLIQLTVYESGVYEISSVRDIDTYGYLYTRNFFVDETTNGLIIQDDDGAGNRQFRLTSYLQANVTYFVVVTTYAKMVTGSYSLSARGPVQLSFQATEPTMILTTTSESSTFFSVCSSNRSLCSGVTKRHVVLCWWLNPLFALKSV